MSSDETYGDSTAAALGARLEDDRETYWLRRMWRAFGCASNPDDFKATVRDGMWARMERWAEEASKE